MGSPLCPTLGNAFLVYFERRNGYAFAHETFSLIITGAMLMISSTSPKHLQVFRNFLNCHHANMPYTIENKKQNRMSFLDVQIIHEVNKITTSAYRKPTFSVVHAHFEIFLPSA